MKKTIIPFQLAIFGSVFIAGILMAMQVPDSDQIDKLYSKVGEIPVPKGFQRIAVKEGSFEKYLRDLEMKTENNICYLYDGTKKGNQTAHYQVLKMDVGKRDLQQCADAVMRLKAEHQFKQKQYNKIKFLGANGKYIKYTDRVGADRSYARFRKYMDHVFNYSYTGSLNKQLKKVKYFKDLKIGDVLIKTGNPYGHAETVMDVAVNSKTGERVYLLSQSYMPAQEIEILNNPDYSEPWYYVSDSMSISTPEYYFEKSHLKRFE